MFWNAYQLDANSPKPKIAKACASDADVQKAQLGKLVNGRFAVHYGVDYNRGHMRFKYILVFVSCYGHSKRNQV